MSDTSDTEIIYDTLSVSKILGIQESTLRKYCTLMKKENYVFHKNAPGRRIFLESDVLILRKIMELKNTTSLSLEQSVKHVLQGDISTTEDMSKTDTVKDITVVSAVHYNQLLNEFLEFKEEQKRFNEELLIKLSKQQETIVEGLVERYNMTLETKQQIASSQSKKWWKFWWQ